MKIAVILLLVLVLTQESVSARKTHLRACSSELMGHFRRICGSSRGHFYAAMLRKYPNLKYLVDPIRSRRDVFSDFYLTQSYFNEAMQIDQKPQSFARRMIRVGSEMKDLQDDITKLNRHRRSARRNIVMECCRKQCTRTTMRKYCFRGNPLMS